MLASTVSRDPDDENFVHDVRIFADGASYAAHVDKSNVELTKAMDSWFGNYDTSVPHTGALFTVGDGNTGKTQRWVPPAQEKVRSEAPTNEALGHRRTIHAVELDQGQAGEACLQSVPLLPRWDGWQAAVAALETLVGTPFGRMQIVECKGIFTATEPEAGPQAPPGCPPPLAAQSHAARPHS